MQRPHGVSACASCKHQRKKCKNKCPLAPFFPAEKNGEFRAVHRTFGVSNASKILRNLYTKEDQRRAADSLIWEASCWQRDPVQGPYGEYKRVVEENKFYKAQYQKITSQVPTTSQGVNMVYKPAVAAATTTALAVAPPVLINGAWNSNSNNNGGVTMMNNVSGGGMNNNGGNFSGVHDYTNGNSNPYAYAANGNHLVVQNMNPQNGSTAVFVPQQHHPISGFNQQYYLAAGQYNSSSNTSGKTAESLRWQGNR